MMMNKEVRDLFISNHSNAHACRYVSEETVFFLLLAEKQVSTQRKEKNEGEKSCLVLFSLVLCRGFTDRQYAHAMFIVTKDKIVTIVQHHMRLKKKREKKWK